MRIALKPIKNSYPKKTYVMLVITNNKLKVKRSIMWVLSWHSEPAEVFRRNQNIAKRMLPTIRFLSRSFVDFHITTDYRFSDMASLVFSTIF